MAMLRFFTHCTPHADTSKTTLLLKYNPLSLPNLLIINTSNHHPPKFSSFTLMFKLLNLDMVDMHAKTITIPLNVYLDLCGQHGRDDDADDFLMYTYKVRRCPRNRAHDWTECPYAHRGEKARRRDPKKFPYQGIVCPDFKNGECKKGQNCEYAHGIFEFWLHPGRFRTRVCESGVLCARKVCFFAHTPEQLRPEGVRQCCSRCEPQGHAAGAASIKGRDEAAAVETEKTLAAAPTASSLAGGAEGSIVRVKGAMDEEYCDFPHLGWVVDLVNW